MSELESLGLHPRAITPTKFGQFLKITGWSEEVESRTDDLAYWLKTDPNTGEEIEMFVPQKPSYRDYEKGIIGCLNLLHEVTGRTLPELHQSIVTSTYDSIRIKIPGLDAHADLDQAIAYIDGGHAILQSCACAVHRKARNFSSRKSKEVNDFMKKLRLGQSEPGSFVLKILVPVGAALHSESMGVADPFPRLVTIQTVKSLSSLLEASRNAVSTQNVADAFFNAVSSGVSGNLCRSVAQMFRATNANSILLDFDWAKTRTPPVINYPSRIEISDDIIDVIEEASSVFSSSEQEIDFEGMVVRLDRDATPGEATEVEVTLYGNIDDKPRKVQLSLSGERLETAKRAFADGYPIACSGLLKKENRSYVLSECTSFSLLTET